MAKKKKAKKDEVVTSKLDDEGVNQPKGVTHKDIIVTRAGRPRIRTVPQGFIGS